MELNPLPVSLFLVSRSPVSRSLRAQRGDEYLFLTERANPSSVVSFAKILLTLLTILFTTVSCGLEGPRDSATVGVTSPDVSKNHLNQGLTSPASRIMQCQATSFKQLRLSDGHQAAVTGLFPLRTSTGAVALLSTDISGLVLSWDVGRGKAYELAHLPTQANLVDIAPDCDLLAYASRSSITLFSLAKKQVIAQLPRKVQGTITALSFSPTADAILFSSMDGNIYRWRFALTPQRSSDEAKVFERYNGHPSAPLALAYHPYGRVFFSADWSGSLLAWLTFDVDDPFAGQYDENLLGERFFTDRAVRMRALRSDTTGIDNLVVTPTGEMLFAALQTGTIELWQVRGLSKIKEIQAHQGLIYDLAVSPDGKQLASAGRDGKLKLWSYQARGAGEAKEAYDLLPLREFEVPQVRFIAFVGENRLFAGTASGAVLDLDLTRALESAPRG